MDENRGEQGIQGIQGIQGEPGLNDERGEVREALIAGLAASAGELSNVAQELTAATKLGRIERWTIVIVSLLVLVMATGSFFAIQNLRDIGETNKANSNQIKDCTTPGGVCYENSRKTTGEAVSNINEVTIAAAYCAQFNTTQETIRACIETELVKN